MATREITQLQDRFTGDVNKIRDEKIATASNASGASDMTSQCEYLIKNGQTGEFMNFLKSYIDESVRSALGALVNNLDKGTSIKSVLATDADNDLGSITPANLASVLSAALTLPLYDIGEIMDQQLGYVGQMSGGKSCIGYVYATGPFIHFHSDRSSIQIFFNENVNFRKGNASTGWSNWKTLA